MNKTEKQKMLAGELYRTDEELGAEQAAAKVWMVRYNAALASPVSERHALLCERLRRVGKDAVIRPPFHCDYGYNISVGDGVFLHGAGAGEARVFRIRATKVLAFAKDPHAQTAFRFG